MLGGIAHPSTRVPVPEVYNTAFICDGSFKPFWPEQVFWQLGEFVGTFKLMELQGQDREDIGIFHEYGYKRWKKEQINTIMEQILEKNVYSSTSKQR
jgi:hypothetical protein